MTVTSVTFLLPTVGSNGLGEEFCEHSILLSRHLGGCPSQPSADQTLLISQIVEAQDYIHELINKNANMNINLVARLGS